MRRIFSVGTKVSDVVLDFSDQLGQLPDLRRLAFCCVLLAKVPVKLVILARKMPDWAFGNLSQALESHG